MAWKSARRASLAMVGVNLGLCEIQQAPATCEPTGLGRKTFGETVRSEESLPEVCRRAKQQCDVPIGRANVTFRRGSTKRKRGGSRKEYLHELHDVWPLNVETLEEARRRLVAEPTVFSMAALRVASLQAAAATALAQLRFALAETDLPQDELRKLLDQNIKEYFDPETDELRAKVSRTGSRGQFMRTLWLILKPLCDAVAAVAAATMFSCDPSHVHCGVWDWYLRGLIEGSGLDTDYFSSVHLDGKLMLGKKTRKAEAAWGENGPVSSDALSEAGAAWWNLWILLSENVASSALLLLEPGSWNITAFRAKQTAFVWPPADSLIDGTPLKFRSIGPSMQQGDMLVFRSHDVAHGAGRLLDVRSENQTNSAPSSRVSFDARCRCIPHSVEPVRTLRGEMCASAWKWGGHLYHGCFRAGQPTPWCVIRKRTSDAGAGCVLQNGQHCMHPCRRMHLCSRNFDYCDEAKADHAL